MRVTPRTSLAAIVALAGLFAVACGSAPVPIEDGESPSVASSTAVPTGTTDAAETDSPVAAEGSPTETPAETAVAGGSPIETGNGGFPGVHPDLGPMPESAIACSSVIMVVLSLNRIVCKLPPTPGMLGSGSLAYVVRDRSVIAVLRVDGESDTGVLAIVEDMGKTTPAIGDTVVLIPAQG
jgi:hypothetical protein